MSGWIKIHRKLFEHWVAEEPEMLACWVHLIAAANHSDKKTMFNGSLIEVKRGQMVFGLNAFSERTRISIKKLRRYLDMFEAEGMLGRQKTNKFSLITIAKYDDYQIQGSQGASKGQTEGKQRATSKECKELEELFTTIFWPAYPRKVAKKDAWKSFQRIAPDRPLTEKIASFARNHYRDSEPQFIPHPATFLNGERWNDETHAENPRRTLIK